jgi:tight adherence protein C
MQATTDILVLAALPGGIDAWDIGLSIGILASVALLVVAVFGQSGRARLSPEREAAIATGHTDRRTVFERPVLGPLMWLLLSLAHRLAMPRVKRWVRQKLVANGNPEYYTPEEYLALSFASGAILGLLLGVAYLVVLDEVSILIAAIGIGLGIGLTVYQLYDRAEKRIRLISKRVPYSLDLIALAMGAGATFSEAVQTVVREETDDPFNVELKTMLAEMDLGTTRRRALQNLSDRVPLDSLRSIVASVIQAEELGTPLGEVLHQQASLLRLHRSVRAENAAAVASVRILVPSLLILISVILAIFGPAILRILERGLFG